MNPLLPIALLVGNALSNPSLEQKIASVLPKPEEERWLQIPWRTDVAQARREAQRTGKPLFFWVMQGHPLGCV
jgi:hypothetical protein